MTDVTQEVLRPVGAADSTDAVQLHTQEQQSPWRPGTRMYVSENVPVMSYCRWSSMNFACDLYAYESEDGYVIHVAGNRITSEIPALPDILTTPLEQYLAAYNEQCKSLCNAVRVPIDLPADGETFVEPTLHMFKERLEQLRNYGYRFPDYVFEMIEGEHDAKR